MSSILSQLRTVADDLNQLHLGWALVGGLAVSVHTEPRTTRDIDVAIALSGKHEFESLVSKLRAIGYGSEQALMDVEPTHQLGFRLQIRGAGKEALPLDLLFASSGIEPEIVSAAIPVEIFPKLIVPVASRTHLIAMKLLAQNNSDRIRDRMDIQSLLRDISLEEVRHVQDSLDLIMHRGFNRSKDLSAELKEMLQLFSLHLSLN